jgi:hypothetical protein
MEMCYLNHGEIYYLRLILLKRPVRNFEDAYTDQDGILHEKFQLSAIAQGYVHDLQTSIEQFTEQAAFCVGRQLRCYFALMMANGFPMWPIYQNSDFKEKLMADYKTKNVKLLLLDIEKVLQKEGTTLEVFGFPTPSGMETELEIAKVQYEPSQQAELLNRLETECPRNIEQHEAFNEVMNKVN